MESWDILFGSRFDEAAEELRAKWVLFGGSFYTTIRTIRWLRMRKPILKRDGYKCLQCGVRGNLHVDHMLPRSWGKGRQLKISNLQTLCRSCNLSKGARVYSDHRVRPWKLPEEF